MSAPFAYALNSLPPPQTPPSGTPSYSLPIGNATHSNTTGRAMELRLFCGLASGLFACATHWIHRIHREYGEESSTFAMGPIILADFRALVRLRDDEDAEGGASKNVPTVERVEKVWIDEGTAAYVIRIMCTKRTSGQTYRPRNVGVGGLIHGGRSQQLGGPDWEGSPGTRD
ncbi:hypothetical protein B0H12DRAFT_1070486 [Mycena haematopus]|nr:hypothetical protein B0H12DRAFT_1070486 [Mycena haematopus]